DAGTDLPLEIRPALAVELHPAAKAHLPSAVVMPAGVAGHVDRVGTALDQLVEQSRKQAVQDDLAALEQNMDVADLRDAFARQRSVGETVAFHQRDATVVIGEHSCG